jgi:hypothetical protein
MIIADMNLIFSHTATKLLIVRVSTTPPSTFKLEHQHGSRKRLVHLFWARMSGKRHCVLLP